MIEINQTRLAMRKKSPGSSDDDDEEEGEEEEEEEEEQVFYTEDCDEAHLIDWGDYLETKRDPFWLDEREKDPETDPKKKTSDNQDSQAPENEARNEQVIEKTADEEKGPEREASEGRVVDDKETPENDVLKVTAKTAKSETETKSDPESEPESDSESKGDSMTLTQDDYLPHDLAQRFNDSNVSKPIQKICTLVILTNYSLLAVMFSSIGLQVVDKVIPQR
jgi:hypothetical protein